MQHSLSGQFAMAFIVIQSRSNCAQVKINRLQVSVNNTKSKGSGELTSTGYSSVRTCEQVRWNRWVKLECNSSESNGVFSKQGAGRQVGVWGKLLTLTAVSRRLRHRWGTGLARGQCGSRVSNRLAISGADKSRGSRQKVCRGQANDQWTSRTGGARGTHTGKDVSLSRRLWRWLIDRQSLSRISRSGETPQSQKQTRTRKRTGKTCGQRQKAVAFTGAETKRGGQRQAESKPGSQSTDECWKVRHNAKTIWQWVSELVLLIYWLGNEAQLGATGGNDYCWWGVARWREPAAEEQQSRLWQNKWQKFIKNVWKKQSLSEAPLSPLLNAQNGLVCPAPVDLIDLAEWEWVMVQDHVSPQKSQVGVSKKRRKKGEIKNASWGKTKVSFKRKVSTTYTV